MNIPNTKSTTLRLMYFAWGMAALFYIYQYILRTPPGVISDDLRETFRMTAEQYSLFGAVYLYAYALLQIPVGKMMDRFGIKSVLIGSIGLCALGALLLGVGEGYHIALLSRILMGIGSAAPFTCAVKIAADAMPANKRGVWTGAVLTLGTMGPIFAGKPLSILAASWGWRELFIVLAACGLLILALMALLVPSHAKYMGKVSSDEPEPDLKELWKTLKQPAILYYAIAAIGLYAPLTVMIDVWGTAFISQLYQLERSNAAGIAMFGYVGLSIGSVLIAWISDRTNKLVSIIRFCSFALMLCFCCLVFIKLPIALLVICFIALGTLCGSEMLCFTGVSYYTTPRNSGFILGCVNTLNMLGGGLLNQLIGISMDYQWHGDLSPTGVRLYSASEYSNSLLVLLPILLLSLAVAYKLPKTQPKN